ncbi:uncharacterized protein LOC119405949 [Rhipicephalus sanguineus]|uniref:uncharacterized protein LOC119405949 n=1 Tax=Rhipicephalus sanguineus TaxID=34632 RepID=UPI00189316B0|nr:uncharacterized protein LOC119405949 [Rhipicephalus sanguineus]
MSRADVKDGTSAASGASATSGVCGRMTSECGVLGVYLSSWDHVMGPQLVFRWRMQCPGAVAGVGIPEPAECGPHFLKCHQFLENPEGFLARGEAPQQASRREEEYDVHAASVLQLLHGGLERRGTRSCLLLLPDKRAALHAVTFDLSAGAPVCLAALFPMKALADLWLLLPLTDLTLARVALVCQTPGRELMKSLSSATSLLHRYFQLASSLLSTRTLDRRASVNALSRADRLPEELIRRALQSHLQTRRCSIVIGDSVAQVEPALNALRGLLDHEELFCSLWGDTLEPCYLPGLQLQGLVRGSTGSPLSARELIWSPHPSTVVDMAQGRVWQCPLHVGYQGPLTRKLKAARTPSAESHVSQFVQQLGRAPTTAAAEQLLQAFQRHLRVKAAALIQCASRSRRALSAKYLQSVLAVPYLSDFLVILAEAEKLRPGLSRYVLPPT